MSAAGIPTDAVDFYGELSVNNTKEWWAAHKARYVTSVREPLEALLTELGEEFGEPYLFRPYRDVRFSPDKRPYKDHQGGLCLTAPGMGYYLQVGAEGLRVGGGYYPSGKDQLVRQRAAIDAPASGQALADLVAGLPEGYELHGGQVATRPRGVAADHPRLELMRYTSLVGSRTLGEPDWMSGPEAVDHLRDEWRAIRPFVEWVTEHVGPSTEPARR